MPEMKPMKRFFEQELTTLRVYLSQMGAKAVDQVRMATQALHEGDTELAAWIRTQDDEIDRLEMEIDAEAIRYISLRGPLAKELRLVISAMNASHEIERIGDEACNIAKRVQKLAHCQPVENLPVEFAEMAEAVRAMVEDALDAFFEGSAEKALAVCHRDEEVDRMHKRFHKDITRRTISDSTIAPAAIELLFAGRSLERIGDHATNVAEDVLYLLRGEDVRHSSLVRKKE